MTTPGGGSLGSATGTIVIRFDDGGVRDAQNALRDTGRSAQDSNAQVQKAAKGMAAAGAIIAGGFLLAIKSAANFEKQLSAVQAVSGATAGEMEQVRQKALQLGADTKFSAGEGANAIEELVKAGISVADVMNGAADATVALAAAGEIDLPTAATIASNAMNQFQLAAKDLPHVADLLAGAANASAIGVTDLGESLSYVGPVAKAVGVNIDDTSAAIAILGNQGIKGSSAGTALRSILSNLVPTTKKATNEFKALGLITEKGTNQFVDQFGAIKPLNEVVQILNDSTKNLSATERNTFAKKSFGLETLSSVSILAGQTGESFDAMAASIRKVSAADVAAARMDNLEGAIEQLKGSFETLMIVVGTPFLNFVGKIVAALTSMVNAFTELPGPIRDTIGVLGALGGATLLALGSIILIAGKIKDFRIALQALAASNAFIAIRSRLIGLYLLAGGPWVAAFAAATAALGALFLFSRKGKPSIEDLTEAIKADAGAFGESTKEAIANRLAKEGLLELADKLGISLGLLTAANAGNTQAQKRLNSELAAMREPLQGQIDDLNLRIAASQGLDAAAQSELESLEAQQRGIDKLTGSVVKNNKELGLSKAQFDQRQRALAGTEEQTDLTTAADERFARALGRQRAASAEATGSTKTLAPVIQQAGAAADASAAQVKKLTENIQALFDEAFGAPRALDAFQTKLNSLKETVKQNGTALQGTTDKAIANREVFYSGAESIAKYADEQRKAGVPADEIASKIGNLRSKLLDQAAAAGFSRDRVKGLISVLGDVKDEYKFTMDADTDPALAAVRNLQQEITNTKGKTIRINVVGGIGALEHATTPKTKPPALAKGGIVNRATLAYIGEGRSSEAVIPLPDLDEMFLRVHGAGAASTAGVGASGAAGGSGGRLSAVGGSSSRILHGSLDISPNGRAFLRGVAEDVYEGEDQFATTYGRMG